MLSKPSVGMSTVDRMSRMYGTVIRVPYTVPADIWSCDYRSRYLCVRLSTVLCRTLTAVYGRHTGLNMYAAILRKLLYINLYKRVVAVGNAYFNHCNDENLKFRQWQSLGRPRDSVTRDAS